MTPDARPPAGILHREGDRPEPAVATACKATRRKRREGVMLVSDAQIHLWENERPDRPWPKDGRSTPHRPNGFTAEQMLAEMDPVGVDRAVIVPPSWIGETNAYALEAAAQYPGRFAVMGRFDPEDPSFISQLPTWLDQPHMLGIRITFNTPTFTAGLDSGMFDPMWAGA